MNTLTNEYTALGIAPQLAATLRRQTPPTVVCADYDAMSLHCAQLVRDQLRAKPDSLLCFPAGSTVTGTCRFLREMQQSGEVDFSRALFVALDEWVGLEDESEDCTHFLTKHLYGALGLRKEQVTLFDTHAADLQQECRRIDQWIEQHGGIDLMLLGLGMNGHLGLNEPGCSFGAYAVVVTLSDTTMNVGQKYFSSPTKLTQGITLGIGHMFQTRKVVLQVAGEAKREVVQKMYALAPTADFPGTVMQLLPGALVVLDEAAAADIQTLLK